MYVFTLLCCAGGADRSTFSFRQLRTSDLTNHLPFLVFCSVIYDQRAKGTILVRGDGWLLEPSRPVMCRTGSLLATRALLSVQWPACMSFKDGHFERVLVSITPLGRQESNHGHDSYTPCPTRVRIVGLATQSLSYPYT